MSRYARGSSDPAFSWALLWFGLAAVGAWLPLFLVHPPLAPTLKTRQPVTSSRSGPFVGTVASHGLPIQDLPVLSARDLVAPEAWSIQPVSKPPYRESEPQPAHSLDTPISASIPSSGLLDRPTLLTSRSAVISSAGLPGSILLGGPLTLASLDEKPMVPAARAEQALRASSSDHLLALPLHWRRDMQFLLHGATRVLPAEVVRLPAPHRDSVEEIPVALKAHGPAETTVVPSSAQSEALVESWARRQEAVPAGQVRPVLVVLEPISGQSSVESNRLERSDAHQVDRSYGSSSSNSGARSESIDSTALSDSH